MGMVTACFKFLRTVGDDALNVKVNSFNGALLIPFPSALTYASCTDKPNVSLKLTPFSCIFKLLNVKTQSVLQHFSTLFPNIDLHSLKIG